MSDKHPEESPKTQPAFARIPPWPPKKTARDLGDDSKPSSIDVVLFEHRRQPDKTEAQEQLGVFTINPTRNRSINETLAMRGLPQLLLSISYAADTGGVTVMLIESGRPLLTVSSPGPSDVYSTFQLSAEVAISVLIHQLCK
jgi:hypothetical protein